MPGTVSEPYESRAITKGGANDTGEIKYQVTGESDILAALALVQDEAPATWDIMTRGEITLKDVHVDTENPDKCIFEASVKYAQNVTQPLVIPLNGEAMSWDTGGGTQHVLASLSTVAAYGTGTSTDDNGKLIGVTKDGVDGVDTTVPVFAFSITKVFAASEVGATYVAKVFALTGKTNNAAWKGFAAGEVLFLGASGSPRGNNEVEITFKFAGSPNKTGLSVGSITGIAKKGWEYMWVRYAPAKLGTLKVMGQKPVAVYIEKVYDEGTYTDLGLSA